MACDESHSRNKVGLERIGTPKWDTPIEDDIACVVGLWFIINRKAGRCVSKSSEVDRVPQLHPLPFDTRF